MKKSAKPQQSDVTMEPTEDYASSTYSGTSGTSHMSTPSMQSKSETKSRSINSSQRKPNYFVENNCWRYSMKWKDSELNDMQELHSMSSYFLVNQTIWYISEETLKHLQV